MLSKLWRQLCWWGGISALLLLAATFYPLDRAALQLLGFVLLLSALTQLPHPFRLPRFAAFSVLVLTLFGYCSSHYRILDRAGSTRILQSSHDSFGVESLGTAIRVRSAGKHYGSTSLLGSVIGSVNSYGEVQQLVAVHPVERILWSDLSVFNLSRAATSTRTVGAFVGEERAPWSTLELVEEVSALFVPPEPAVLTERYFALVIEALGRPVTVAAREQLLLSATEIEPRWASFVHQSYPWLLLGNLYLGEYMRTQEYGYWRCARAAYKRARALTSSWRDPELWGAILNNSAVLLQVNARLKESSRRVVVRALLKKAVSVGTLRSPYALEITTDDIAERNLLRVLAQG